MRNTIWIVTYIAASWNPERIVAGVFSTQELAEDYMKAIDETRPGSDPMYAQHTVDVYTVKSSTER